MPSATSFARIALFAAVLAAAAPATAQPRRRPTPPPAAGAPATIPPIAPPDPVMQRAREAYDRGRALFQAGQWAEALVAFREANEARPHPTVLLSIAECQDRLGAVHDAVATLEQYLAASPEARDRDAVLQRIASLRGRPATLRVTSEPAGARIEVDGRDTDRATPAELELPAGEHAIRLRLEGHLDRQERLTLEYGERRELVAELEPEAPPAPPPPRPAPRARRIGRSYTSAWIAASVTGAALVTGGVLGTLALSARADYDEAPTWNRAERGEQLALGADVAFGVALAAGLTTVFALAHAAGSDEAPAPGRAGLASSGFGLSF